MANFKPLLIFTVTLSGCAFNAHLYPTNEVSLQESGGKVLVAKLGRGSFRGYIEIQTKTGEILSGQYARVREDSDGFGQIINKLWPGTTHFLSPVMAFAFGESGTFIRCELTEATYRHWWGICESNGGAWYRIDFVPPDGTLL